MFDDRLKKLREERCLSQQELADKLGLKQRTYSSYENDEREPNSDTLIKIALFFNVSVDTLLGINARTSKYKEIFHLTNNEKQLITAYRNHPEMQAAVNKMLDIEDKAEIRGEIRQNLKADKYSGGDTGFAYLAAKGHGTRKQKAPTLEQQKAALKAIAKMDKDRKNQ